MKTGVIWLFLAVWMDGQSPSDYKIVAKVGPFEKYTQCWGAGTLAANAIQSKDAAANAIGACVETEPHGLSDMKSMWDMACAVYGKPNLCWLQNGEFVSPIPTDEGNKP